MKYHHIVLICFLFIGGFSHASGSASVSISQLGLTRSGVGYVFLNVVSPLAISNCSRTDQVRWELDNDIGRGMLSIALTAKASGKKIKITAQDNDCLGDAPRPMHLSIEE